MASESECCQGVFQLRSPFASDTRSGTEAVGMWRIELALLVCVCVCVCVCVYVCVCVCAQQQGPPYASNT